jgi:hypothetical protein
MLDVNAKGVFLCYAAAARQMVKQGRGTLALAPLPHSVLLKLRLGGVIIGACSIAGYRGSDVSALYSMSKCVSYRPPPRPTTANDHIKIRCTRFDAVGCYRAWKVWYTRASTFRVALEDSSVAHRTTDGCR